MNEEAFNTMYILAQKEGYKKTPEEFKTLLSSNQEALNTMYSIAQREGYKKTPEEFKILLGVSGVEGEPVNFTEGSGEQQEQPTEPLEKDITIEDGTIKTPEMDFNAQALLDKKLSEKYSGPKLTFAEAEPFVEEPIDISIPEKKDIVKGKIYTPSQLISDREAEILELNEKIKTLPQPQVGRMAGYPTKQEIYAYEERKELIKLKNQKEKQLADLKNSNDDILSAESGSSYFLDGKELTRSQLRNFATGMEFTTGLESGDKDFDIKVENDEQMEDFILSQKEAADVGFFEKSARGFAATTKDILIDGIDVRFAESQQLLADIGLIDEEAAASSAILGSFQPESANKAFALAKMEVERDPREKKDFGDAFLRNYSAQIQNTNEELRGKQLERSYDVIDLLEAGEIGAASKEVAKMSVESLPYTFVAMTGWGGSALIANSVQAREYYDLRNQGVSKEKALISSGLAALIETADAALESKIFKSNISKARNITNQTGMAAGYTKQQLKDLSKNVFSSYFKEMPTELAQGTLGELNRQWATDKPIDFESAIRAGVIESLAAAPTSTIISSPAMAKLVYAPVKRYKDLSKIQNTIGDFLFRSAETTDNTERKILLDQSKMLVNDFIAESNKIEQTAKKATEEESNTLKGLTLQEFTLERTLENTDNLSPETVEVLQSKLDDIGKQKSELIKNIDSREDVAVEDVAAPDSFIFSEEAYKEAQRFVDDAKTKKISIEEVVNNDPTATELDKKLISALSPFLKGKNVYYQDGFNYNISNELVDDSGGYGATISENGDILVFDENNLNTEIILHEGLHSLVFTKINETTRNEKDQVFVDEIQRIFDFVRNDSDLVSRYDYAFTNLDEFISEAFGNRNFRQELSYISDETSGVKSNVFKSFIDSIRKFLKLEYNFEIDNSALESILNAVDYTLQDKRDTTQETSDLIEEQEYTQFVDEGVVSEERIQSIADKVRQQQELTPREQEIFTDKTSEVNQKIAEFAPTEEVSETVETISPLSERLKNVRVARVGDTFDKGKRGEAINEKEIEEAQSVLMDELNEIEKSNLPQEQKDAASAEVEKLFNELENYELTTETKTRQITQKRPTRVVREGVKEQTKSPQERSINRAVRMPEEEGVGVSEGINTQIQSIRDKIEKEKQRRSETRERRKKKGIAKESAGRIFTNSFKKQEELEQELERLIKKEKQGRVEDKAKKKEQVTVVLEEQDGKIVLQAFDKDGSRTTAKELELESVNDLELVDTLKDEDGKVIGATVRNKNNDAEVFSIMDEELALDYAIEKTKAEVGEMSIEEESVFEEYEEVKKRPTKKKPTKEVVKEEVTEKVEPTKPITEETLTEEEASALDDILGFSGQKKRVYTDNKSESDKRRLKRVNNALDKIEDSFQKIFPNLYIGIAEDSDMFARFAKEQNTSKESRSRGVFTPINVEGEPKRYGIILNPDFANVTTAFHEAFHALMKVNGFNNEQARAVTSRMIKSVQKGATPELNENLERFVSQYETPEQSEEYMSELFGILSYNYSKQSGTVKGIIKRWLRKLAEIIGLKPKNTLLSSVGLSDSDAATVNMLNVLADKMSRGKVLSKEDVTSLRMGGPLTVQQVAADMRMDDEQGGIKKQMPQSASKVLYNDSDVLPKPSKKKSNSQVAQDLAEVAAEYYGGNIITSNTITAKQEEEIIQVGTEEAIKAFEDSGKSAADWYSTAIQKAMAVAAVIHPSLSSKEEANKYDIFNKEKDPVKAANLAMRIALAITSQNLNVEANAKYANEQFDILKKTGKFDASREYGTKATSISSNLRLANELINKIGLNQSENFITKDFNTARLEEAASEVLGKKVKISGLRNDLVNGAALFGPKIGQGFLQNLMGKFEPVTIDLWLRRTWGRWTGDVVGVGVTEERMARLLNGISEAKKDTGFDIPDFMRKHKVIKKTRPSSGSSYSTMSDSFTNELEDNDRFRNDISIFAKKLTAKANTMYKLIKNEPMSKELYRDFMSGKKTYGQTANELQIIKDKTSDKYKDYASKEKAKGLTPIKKSEWVKTQNKKEGRDVFPNNKAISSRKPEWVKASTTIINDLKPIDIPSNQDRKVITRVVKEIKNRMEKQGYSVTNADVQALLWYPEKDIWSKLRGEEESNLKQSYDEQFIKIAEKQGLGKEAQAAAEGIKSRRTTQLGGTDGRTTDVKVSRPIAKKETESIKKSKRQPREQLAGESDFIKKRKQKAIESFYEGQEDINTKEEAGEFSMEDAEKATQKLLINSLHEYFGDKYFELNGKSVRIADHAQGTIYHSPSDFSFVVTTSFTKNTGIDDTIRAYEDIQDAIDIILDRVGDKVPDKEKLIKKSKRQPEKNKKLKEAIEFAKDNNLSPKKLNNYLLSKGYTQEEIDEATPVKSKPKESIKKLINKVSRLTDNNEARAIVAKGLRELLKDSKLSQFSKRTINKVITSLKNTNVSNMQKMLDKVDDAISNDEGRLERIKRYKNRSIAIKRIAKIGPLKELQDPFIRMMGIDPKYLSKKAQKEYDSVLSDILNINKKYDKTSRDTFKAKIDLVLDSYDIDSVRAKEIADRINELIDPTKTLNTNLARLEKDKKITKEERELITRFKSLLDESSVADPMAGYTEEEIEEYKGMLEAEKRESIEEDFIETLSQPQSAFYSTDDAGAFKLSEEERRYVKEANSITLKDIQELSLRDAKSVVRALEAMKAGFLTPELFQGVIKVRGVRGNMSIPLNEIKQTGVVDKVISKVSAGVINAIPGKGNRKTGIGNRLRKAPTRYYEQVLKTEKELLSDGSKRFKGTNIYKSLFKPTSTAFSKSEQTLTKIEDKLKNATALLSRNQNERFIQKAKIMVFQIQREYDSNVGNKEVNQAKDWINATIKDKDTALDERDIIELEKIRDRYLTDGQVDAKKLYDSLTANEKKALEIIDGVYDELTFMARMDAAVQGMPFIHRENYIHLPKSGTKTSEISNDFDSLFDSFMNASVKNKAAIQRTGKTHSISFDPVSNAYAAARKISVGYNMYPVIKSARIAFSGLKNRAETRFEKDLVNELESTYDRIINSQYKNVTKDKILADNIFRYLTKAGYFSQLSGVVKAASELGVNTLHAVMNHAGGLVDGYATLVSVDTKTIDKALENTDTTQMDRLTKTAKFDSKDIESKLLSKAKLFNPEQMTGELAASAKTVGKVAAMPFQAVFKLNESLITKPDEMVIRPLFIGEFQNKFKQLTGQKLNWEKLANDESYRDRFQEAINQASEQADSAVIDTSASTNPFDTIPSNISDPDADTMKKIIQVVNRYMTNFRVFEYYSAVKGVQNLLGKGEISRGAGMMLLASTIMRMSIYRLGIDYAFGLIFSALGMGEDEDEIKKEDLTRSALSGIVTLAFGRNLGNLTQSAINLGIEYANMEFGEGITWDSVTKDGEKTEYDPYKDSMVFSKIPVKRSPGRDLFTDFLISSAGPLTPTIKSVRRATTLTDRSIYNKTKESRDKNKNELFFKTPFDIAGSLGFIPNYKELKKLNDRYWFGGNRDTEKKTKGKILGRTRTQSSRSSSTGRKAPRSNRTR